MPLCHPMPCAPQSLVTHPRSRQLRSGYEQPDSSAVRRDIWIQIPTPEYPNDRPNNGVLDRDNLLGSCYAGNVIVITRGHQMMCLVERVASAHVQPRMLQGTVYKGGAGRNVASTLCHSTKTLERYSNPIFSPGTMNPVHSIAMLAAAASAAVISTRAPGDLCAGVQSPYCCEVDVLGVVALTCTPREPAS